MNKSLVLGLVAGATAVTAAGALASRTGLGLLGPTYAQVVSVKPVTKSVRTPREACHDEQVTVQKPVKDEHKVAGTLLGAVVGGVLGNQVGGGNGKKLATVAGAAAGGYAGNRIQDKMQKGDTEARTERRCETVYDRIEKPAGYQVTYRMKDKTGVVHMDHDPGSRLEIRNGKPVTELPDAPKTASR
jgi:uncharacterized protein YcfJ